MERIGSRLGYHVDIGARVAPVAGVVGRGLDFEFLDGIRIWNRDSSVNAAIAGTAAVCDVIDGDAVHLEIILPGIGAIGAVIRGGFPESSGVAGIGVRTGRHTQDLGVVAIA